MSAIASYSHEVVVNALCYSLALHIGVGSARVTERLKLYILGTLRYGGSALTQGTPLDRYRISKHKGLEETALCAQDPLRPP